MTGAGERLVGELTAALLRERELLMAGRFDALADAAAAREALTERLEGMDSRALSGGGDALARMRRAAARNVELLRAALDGLAAGRRRIGEIAEARQRLSSYDAHGAPVDRATVGSGGRRA
jgi:hypothetical protein